MNFGPQGMMPPAHDAPWNPFLGPAGLVPMPMHGEPVVPVGPPAQPPVQLDRLGRNPDDVQAMLMENARRQYEQRFGMSPMGPRGQQYQSMAASGQQEQLDELIRRLAGVPQGGPATGAQNNRINRMRRGT